MLVEADLKRKEELSLAPALRMKAVHHGAEGMDGIRSLRQLVTLHPQSGARGGVGGGGCG